MLPRRSRLRRLRFEFPRNWQKQFMSSGLML